MPPIPAPPAPAWRQNPARAASAAASLNGVDLDGAGFPSAQNGAGPQGQGGRIAVIGSGIAGLSAAWALSRRFAVTLFEAEPRPGGHSCTIDVPHDGATRPVDMGFIVYNEPCYPNLTALFAHLGVPTQASDMSLGLSLDGGAFEYGGSGLGALLAQPANLLRPRMWSMLASLIRLYRTAPADLADTSLSLGAWLDAHGYSAGFQRDHLLPMAAAIWSCPAGAVRDQPAASFFRFCANHALLQFTGRPRWRTVTGGSRAYVQRLLAATPADLHLSTPITAVTRGPNGVTLHSPQGPAGTFDHAVLAVHGNQAARLLAQATADEAAILGALRTTANRVVMHRDPRLMPSARRAWSAWNFLAPVSSDPAAAAPPCVTYWMNRLQGFTAPENLFVTVNPPHTPTGVITERIFHHPLFDADALAAQRAIWSIQGQGGVWYAGAWAGAGFHEDGIQAGLHVAEAIGAPPRPWASTARDLSARLHLTQAAQPA